MSWEEVARENRGLAEAIIVMTEYRATTENKVEIDAVLERMVSRFDWTIYTLKQLEKDEATKGKEVYIDPGRDAEPLAPGCPEETSA
jgi:hypothetical protein